MGRYLHEILLKSNLLSKEQASLIELLSIIKRDRQLDIDILEAFPLDKIKSPKIFVYGCRALIQSFLEINNEKLDIIECLSNIKITGLNTTKQLLITFIQDALNTEGTYRFSHTFLDMLFQMGNFYNYCINSQKDKILLDTVRRLCKEEPNKKLQFRLLQDNGKWLIRGVTSTSYKNYDNHLALYLTLFTLHQNASLTGERFMLEKAHLSDSEIVVTFDQVTPQYIVGVGKLYFGLILINNEIKEKAFTLECRFRLEDNEGNNFGAIPPEGKETIFKIRHNSSMDRLSEDILKAHHLRFFKDKITQLIIGLANAPYLSEDRIYSVFKTILGKRNKFSQETREALKELQQEKIITNSLHIIDAFHRLSELVTDVEEKIHLERILYDVCLDLSK